MIGAYLSLKIEFVCSDMWPALSLFPLALLRWGLCRLPVTHGLSRGADVPLLVSRLLVPAKYQHKYRQFVGMSRHLVRLH
jgi:hypothetical protein